MVGKSESPLVTGISPVDGPPGTIAKIRGEHLGLNAKDVLGVYICNVNCTHTAEWQHSRLIHCRTGIGLGFGDIIVYTKSGGIGTSLVKFRGYMPRVGLLTEAAVWVDESKLFEEKASTTLNNSRAYAASASMHTDPLGVASEETGAVLPADKIEEWYPELLSNTLSENFSASRFLLERHLDTSFSALKSGYYHLQSQDTRTSVGPSSFVRGNLTTILDSLSTLSDVSEMKSADDESSTSGDICGELQGVLNSCGLASNSLFKDILARKDEADTKRNVLNILHRYRFLFNLHRSIELNIQQGDYEILISDYNRVKALFQNSHVKSFQKALAEVDKKVASFSSQLKQRLFDFPVPLEEQKKFIRYLNDLNHEGVAVDCITKQSAWIKSMLLECQTDQQNRKPKISMNIDLKRKDLIKVPDTIKRLQSIEAQSTPDSILMVERLCRIISKNVPDLWYLGQAFLSHQLGEKVHHQQNEQKRENFENAVRDIIILFCDIVKNVLCDDTSKSMKLIPWLPTTAQSVRSTLERLNKIGLLPRIISTLKELTTDLIADCVKKILNSAVEDVNDLFKEEDWQMENVEDSLSITNLPNIFEKIFTESMKFVHAFMKDSKLDSLFEMSTLNNEVEDLLGKMLEGYMWALERTAYPNALDCDDDTENFANEAICKPVQMLLVLSNCQFTKTIMLPRLLDQCSSHGYHKMEELRNVVIGALTKLDERVFTSYMNMIGRPIVSSIQPGILLEDFSWLTRKPVTGVRDYLRDVIMKVVFVHNQVSSASTYFVPRILASLADAVCNEKLDILKKVNAFSSCGYMQATLELTALQTVVGTCVAEGTRKKIHESLINLASNLNTNDEENVNTMLNTFKKGMRYQLAIFDAPNNPVPVATKEKKSIEKKSRIAPSNSEKNTDKKEISAVVENTNPFVDAKKSKRKAPPPPVIEEESGSSSNPFIEPPIASNPFLDEF